MEIVPSHSYSRLPEAYFGLMKLIHIFKVYTLGKLAQDDIKSSLSTPLYLFMGLQICHFSVVESLDFAIAPCFLTDRISHEKTLAIQSRTMRGLSNGRGPVRAASNNTLAMNRKFYFENQKICFF